MKFLSHKKNLLSVGIVVLLVIGVLVTYYLVQQRQDIRQHAGGGSQVGLSLQPSTTTIAPGQQFTVSVLMTDMVGLGSNAISAADIKLNYPTNLLRVDSFTVQQDSVFKQNFNPSTQQMLLTTPIIANGSAQLIVGAACDDNQTAPQLPQPYKCYTVSSSGKIATLTITALAEGSATISFDPATAVSAVSNENNVIGGTNNLTLTIQNAVSSTPVGYLGSADCSQITGWTCSAQNFSQELTVYLYDLRDNSIISTPVANAFRSDLVAANVCGGTGNHGFVINTPNSLKDGQVHTIQAYAINPDGSGNNPILSNSPKTLQCSAPITPPADTPTPIPSTTGTVSANIGFQGITANTSIKPDRTVTVTFRQGATEVKKFANVLVHPDAKGIYNVRVIGIPAGTYDMFVVGLPYLQKKYANTVVVAGSTTTLDLSSNPLSVGDFVGAAGGTTPPDNDITLADLGSILTQYKALSNPVKNGNEIYDLNGDNTINLLDIGFLLTNYKALDNFGDQ